MLSGAMSGKIIAIPSLSKLHKFKWPSPSCFFFVALISSNFLLAGVGSVHGAKQAIDIILDNGATRRITRKEIFTHSQFQVTEDENKVPIQIGSTYIVIDRSKPFRLLIRSLRATPGIKSATLVWFLPDERCANKIRKFNEVFHSGLLLSKQIQLRRKFCSSLLKYQKQDSTLAKENLPIEQYKLGIVLANSVQGLEDEIPLLMEAKYLLENSINLGFQHAESQNILETLEKIKQRLESLTAEAI